MPSWEFLLADNAGNVTAELTKIRERKVQMPLSRVVMGSFIMDASDPLVNTVRQTDLCFVKAYRDNVLMGQGPVINTQKVRSSSASSMTVNWGGIGWRLGIRLIEESKKPTGIEYGKPAEAEWEDMGQMAIKIINGLNVATVGGEGVNGIVTKNIINPYGPAPAGPISGIILPQANTGIRVGTILPCARTNVGPWFYQNALQGISLLASPLSGFDWEIEPVEPFSDSIGLVFGTFNCQPNIGSTREDVAFEWGDGKHNVAEFTELIDGSGLLNRAYSTPEGFPENAKDPTLEFYDYVAMLERGTIYEDIIPSDAVTEELRNRLLQNQISVRKNPKAVITFKPTNDRAPGVLPTFRQDYNLGDIVIFRSVEYGVTTFEGLVRIYEVDFEIDDVGDETATPVLLRQET